jgi:hypothetical protein
MIGISLAPRHEDQLAIAGTDRFASPSSVDALDREAGIDD